MAVSWNIFTRDVGRILRTPKVWVIVIGVLITPALYSWVNVAAFWDPYGNTQNVGVAVVNEDEGGTSDITGPIDVGGQMMDQLEQNDQLGWQFMDEDEADDALKKGDVSASITVPASFSSDILSMFEGTYSQPTIQYQVNEKKSAISPKITDQGATTLDSTITSVFKETVSEAVTTQLRDAGGSLGDRLNNAGDRTANAFDETAGTMASAQDEVTRVQERLDGTRPTIAATQDALRSVDATLGDATTALDQVQSIMTEVQEQVSSFSDAATSAYIEGTTALADGTASANAAISSVTGELERAGSGLDTATREVSGIVRQADQAISQLQSLLDNAAVTPGVSGPLRDTLNELQERNATNQELLDELSGLQGNASDTVSSVNAAADALAAATSDTRDRAQGLRTSVSDSLPALNSAINQVNSTAGAFSSALSSQRTLLGESITLLDGVDRQIGTSQDVLGSFKNDLSGIEDGLKTARADVLALSASSGDGILGTVSNLDSVGISEFMATPAEVESHAVYPVANYGSGMAGLFTNLSLWIGAFILMVIFRTEVDTARLKKLTVAQAYRGRFILLAVLSTCQGVVVSVGNLVIGVQTVNPVAFIATCVAIGLCYLSIVYALISALGNIGRGIAVVLAFLQIPGASGLYPIEMTPDFFQALHPILPLTYGIDALRETIGGFYGNHYWKAMGTLLVMAVLSFVLGTLLRRGLSNVKGMVNRQHAASGLIVDDQVEVVGSSYRLTDVIHAMRDRDAFRNEIDNRWKPLRENYPTLLRAAIITGVVGIVILCVLARIYTDEKALIFGLVCLWCLLIVGVIAALEYVKQSFAHVQELSDLSEEELQEAADTQSARPKTYSLDGGNA
ncbi:YhgE/Pip domain-containing protein [Corynebacterium glyciniphilum]|uniref:YhgE/Pip domain-containing protein n=1 Tax=Corynebacterium glyciniphilum TaxID=1404244 RepID=UPI00265117A2|nr:YhgE/Pip domain-containing protein [Corynebacterium glyciniphilum]MDN6707380.1 YhgE/Pip domain-containing protein [Corynebacterium glyciniphilum]